MESVRTFLIYFPLVAGIVVLIVSFDMEKKETKHWRWYRGIGFFLLATPIITVTVFRYLGR